MGEGPTSEEFAFLVVDQVGSTVQIATIGDERAAEIRLELYDLVAEPVFRFGGEVFNYTGDGLMATFGSVDDALWAAVAMQHGVAATAAGRAPGEEIEIRVGVHTGPTVVTDAGHFVGASVHLAARLCDVAGTSEIAVTGPVRARATDSAFRFRPAGLHSMKGFFEPVEVHDLPYADLVEPRPRGVGGVAPGELGPAPVQVRLVSDPAPLVARHDAVERFVGRAEERRALRDAVAAAAVGSRRVVLIGGEPGSGKSTLVARELGSDRTPDLLTLVGRSVEIGELPFGPFVEAMTAVVDQLPVPELTDHFARHGDAACAVFPSILDRIGVDAVARRIDEMARHRLFEAVVDLLDRITSLHPTALVLEDLHWASEASLELLVHLHRSSMARNLVVIGSYRATDVDRTSPLTSVLARLWREPGTVGIELAPLSPEDVEELLDEAGLGGPGAAAAGDRRRLAVRIQEETGGSAFYVAEIVAALVSSGADPSDRSLPIPSSVRAVVEQRMAPLDQVARDVLAAAAIAGNRVEADVLTSLLDLPEDDVIDALEDAIAAGLVVEVDDPRRGVLIEFVHALIASTLRDGVSPLRRRRLHARIAESLLEGSPGEVARQSGSILVHLEAAGRRDRLEDAVATARDGLAWTMGRVAYEDAVAIARIALRLLAEWADPGDRRAAEFHLALGEALNGAGHVADAEDHFVEAVTIDDGTATLVRAALGHGGPLPAVPPLDPVGIGLLQHGLERDDVGDDDRALVLARLAERRHLDLPDDLRVRLLDAADEVATDPHVIASVIISRFRTLHGPAWVDHHLARTNEVGALARSIGDDVASFGAANFEAVYSVIADDFARADAAVDRARTIARRLRQPEFLRMSLMYDGMRLFARGAYDRAEEVRTELLDVLVTGQHSQATIVHGVIAVPRLWMQGGADELGPLLAALAPKYGPSFGAWMAAEVGDLDLVRNYLDEARPVEELLLDQSYVFWQAAVGYTVAAAALDDAALARRVYDVIAPYSGQNMTGGMVVYFGNSHHHLGVLARTFGDFERADTHFAEARTRQGAAGARPFQALTAAEWLLSLGDRTPPPWVDADALRTEAEATADELDLVVVANRLARLDRN